MKKTVLIIIGVLLVAGLVVGGYYLWQNNITIKKGVSSNLRFYKSDSLGISFYYNPNFEIKNFEGILTLSDKTKKIEKAPAGAIPKTEEEKYTNPSFQISLVGEYSNIGDFIDRNKNITIVENCKNVTISSNNWYECVVGGYGAYKIFVIEKNQKILEFLSETREYEMIKGDMKKTLETIEFLNI